MTIGGFVIAFIRGWNMALVCAAALPIMAMATFFFTWVIQNGMSLKDNAYSIAGGRAEQVINSIKTVKSLTGEEFELQRYGDVLHGAFKTSVRYGFYTGLSLGSVYLTCFLDYALGFWYGSVLIDKQVWNDVYGRPYTTGDVLAIFFAIIIGK
jgi:ATP-binding cassette subfamily B (MDR/TAP) protein 1